MSLRITPQMLMEMVDAIDTIKPPSRAVLTCGFAGLATGMNCGLDMTEEMRKEFGLGGQLFGWFVVTPFVSIITTVVGCTVGAGLESGIGKIARVAGKLM